MACYTRLSLMNGNIGSNCSRVARSTPGSLSYTVSTPFTLPTRRSTLVGAVAMARAVDDDRLSRAILETAGEALKSRLG